MDVMSMYSEKYGEKWEPLEDISIITRVKSCLDKLKYGNFSVYDKDFRFAPGNGHYIVLIYGGRNGNGEWVKYLSEMTKLFKLLLNPNEGKFEDVCLIELGGRSIDDTFSFLIGLK